MNTRKHHGQNRVKDNTGVSRCKHLRMRHEVQWLTARKKTKETKREEDVSICLEYSAYKTTEKTIKLITISQ